jgi:hypothetical protein
VLRIHASIDLPLAANEPTGEIWFDVGTTRFPCEGWDDFPLAVLSELLARADAVRRSFAGEAEVSFFEGDFVVLLERSADSKIKLTFVDWGRAVGEVHVDADELVAMVREKVDGLLRGLPEGASPGGDR